MNFSLLLFFLATFLLAPHQEQGTPVPPFRWRTDYALARKEAEATHKPLFVYFQCLRPRREAEQNSIDLLISRNGGTAETAALLNERFVPVRLTSVKNIDLNTFRFDYDLTFAALVLDPRTEKTLARWGTRDETGMSNRVSLAGLARMMRQVVENAAILRPERAKRTAAHTIADYPAFAQTNSAKQACYHCHYATDARFVQARADGKFSKALLFQYPLPENIGVTLDTNENNRVQSIRPASPAERAGIRLSDILVSADGAKIYSAADLQSVLNGIPDTGKVTLKWRREDGGEMTKTLTLPKGWRETDISWRASQGAIPPIIGIWETALTPDEKRAHNIAPDKVGLRVSYLFTGAKWEKGRGDFQLNDIIVAAEGTALPTMTPQQFHAWFRLHYDVGATAVFTVLRGGKRVMITVPCVDIPL